MAGMKFEVSFYWLSSWELNIINVVS